MPFMARTIHTEDQNMSEGGNRNWGTITAAVVLLAVVVGLLYFYFTGLWLPAIGLPILIVGVYMLFSAFLRSSEPDRYGTSDSGAATLYGFILIAIGGAIVVYQYAENLIFTAAFAIVIVVLYLITAAVRKKNN